MPFEKPAKTLARRNAAANTTMPAEHAAVHAHAEHVADDSRMIAWIIAVTPGADDLREDDREPRRRRREEAVDHVAVEVGIIAIPDHEPPKKAFMQTIPGVRNSM